MNEGGSSSCRRLVLNLGYGYWLLVIPAFFRHESDSQMEPLANRPSKHFPQSVRVATPASTSRTNDSRRSSGMESSRSTPTRNPIAGSSAQKKNPFGRKTLARD